MGDDNNDTCSGGYGDSGCSSYGGGYSDGGYGDDDSSDGYGYGDSDDGCDDSEEDSADGYSSDNSYSSADDGDSYGFDSDYGDYSSDSYVSDDAAADEMDFSDITSGWSAVGNDATDTFSDFCDEVMAEGEAAYNDFANTVESALNTISNTFSSIKSSLTDTPEDTDSQTATNTPEQSSYMDLYDPEGYLAESNNPDDAISPDSRGILSMAVDAIADGITQRQQEITEELPDYVNAVNDAQNTSSYLSDLGNPDENTYTPNPDDVPTGNPGILSMGMTALANHFNHPPQELIDAANEMKETVNKGDLSSYPEDQPAEEAPVNPDDDIAPNSKGFISTVAEALTLGAKAIANRINNPSPTLQQAAQEMKDRAERGQISAYADDEYSHEQEENYTGYELGQEKSEKTFQNLRDPSNVWAKNTFTNVADTAISSQHIFTSQTVTPFTKANINTITEGAAYGLKSAKTVTKSSVVGLTFATADAYSDITNENFTTTQKREAVAIDLAGAAFGIGVGVLIASASVPLSLALVGGIIVNSSIDKFSNFTKGRLGLNK